MPASETYIDIDGCRVRVARAGTGKPLVFLHGANGPALWTPFFEELSKRYQVIAPDHPSFGASGNAAWLENIGDLAYFYLDFFKTLKLKSVHVVGHSMGGWLAAEIAIRSTQNIATLTLMSAAGLRVPGHSGMDIFMTPPPELLAAVYATPKFRTAALEELNAPKTPEQLDLIIRNRTAAANLCWHPRLNNPQLARWLHRIDVPTRLIWGDSDKLIPPEHGREYAKRIPRSRLKILGNCGHSPQIEKAPETLALINGFIEEHP